jgi:hypothetical protein
MERVIIVALVIIVLFLIRKLYYDWMRRSLNIVWIESNVEIIKSECSSRTYGNDISYAKGESTRRVKLTVKIILSNGKSIITTRRVWTKTKNRAFFYEGQYVAILYDQENPKRFKLKYDI